MAKTDNLNIRIEPELKKEVEMTLSKGYKNLDEMWADLEQED